MSNPINVWTNIHLKNDSNIRVEVHSLNPQGTTVLSIFYSDGCVADIKFFLPATTPTQVIATLMGQLAQQMTYQAQASEVLASEVPAESDDTFLTEDAVWV